MDGELNLPRDFSTGKDCVININECEPNPCLNHAKCLDSINGFHCVCKSFFKGVYSEKG